MAVLLSSLQFIFLIIDIVNDVVYCFGDKHLLIHHLLILSTMGVFVVVEAEVMSVNSVPMYDKVLRGTFSILLKFQKSMQWVTYLMYLVALLNGILLCKGQLENCWKHFFWGIVVGLWTAFTLYSVHFWPFWILCLNYAYLSIPPSTYSKI